MPSFIDPVLESLDSFIALDKCISQTINRILL